VFFMNTKLKKLKIATSMLLMLALLIAGGPVFAGSAIADDAARAPQGCEEPKQADYTVEHYKQLPDGSYPETPDDTDTETGDVGDTATAVPREYPGYTLDEDKSTVTGTILEDGSLVLELYYKATPASEDAPYTVEHYKQLPDGSYPDTPNDTDSETGTPGDTVTAVAREYPEYTLDEDKSTVTGTILEDGSLVLKLYYKKSAEPANYNVYYDANTGTGEQTDPQSPYAPGETVTVMDKETLSKSGYIFIEWNTAANGSGTDYNPGSKFTMPDTDVTLFAQWKKKSSGGSSGGSGSGGSSTTTPTTPTTTPETTPAQETSGAVPTTPTLNKQDHFAYIIGYPENIVRPEGNITREEVAAVFYRLLDPAYRNSIKTTSLGFGDVEANRWSSKHIGTLAKGQILSGYPDGSFRPGSNITRAEIAVIASKFEKLAKIETNKFSDISLHWAKEYINSAAENGWFDGYPDGTFKPDQYITRAEFVTLVNKVLDRRVHSEDILPEARQFPDLIKGAWHYEAMQEAINSHHYNRKSDTFDEWLEIYHPTLEW